MGPRRGCQGGLLASRVRGQDTAQALRMVGGDPGHTEHAQNTGKGRRWDANVPYRDQGKKGTELAQPGGRGELQLTALGAVTPLPSAEEVLPQQHA